AMYNNIHNDSLIVVKPDFTLCTEPYEVDMILPPMLDCLNPTVVGVADYIAGDPFVYSIAQATANTFRLTITPKLPGAHFTTVPHMVVSIDTPASPTPRTAFVLGIQAKDGVCVSPASITPQLSFGSCLP